MHGNHTTARRSVSLSLLHTQWLNDVRISYWDQKIHKESLDQSWLRHDNRLLLCTSALDAYRKPAMLQMSIGDGSENTSFYLSLALCTALHAITVAPLSVRASLTLNSSTPSRLICITGPCFYSCLSFIHVATFISVSNRCPDALIYCCWAGWRTLRL